MSNPIANPIHSASKIYSKLDLFSPCPLVQVTISCVQTILKRAICSPVFHYCPQQSIFHSAARIGL